MSHAAARNPEPVAVPRDSRLDAHAALADLPREHGFEPLAVDGRIPADLQGTIYRNGATLMSAGGRRYAHWFDGDGGLSAVRFGGGTVTGAARVVQSAGLREERAAGKLLYGGFGTVQPGLFRRMRGTVKNTANTSVMWWQERLFALMEAARPTEMDPDTLETLGERDLDGVVAGSFSAHPHRVPVRRASYNFGVRYGRQTMLDLYELPDQGPARRIASLPLPGPTMIHDFIATENHLIVFIPPLRLRIARLFLGLGGYSDNLAWRSDLGTEVLVVPIDDPTRPIRFTADPFFTWHYSNAFERGRELVVDYVRYPDFTSNRWITEMFRGEDSPRGVADGTFHRAVIDLDGARMTSEERWSRPCEFPRVSPAVERDHQPFLLRRRPLGRRRRTRPARRHRPHRRRHRRRQRVRARARPLRLRAGLRAAAGWQRRGRWLPAGAGLRRHRSHQRLHRARRPGRRRWSDRPRPLRSPHPAALPRHLGAGRRQPLARALAPAARPWHRRFVTRSGLALIGAFLAVASCAEGPPPPSAPRAAAQASCRPDEIEPCDCAAGKGYRPCTAGGYGECVCTRAAGLAVATLEVRPPTAADLELYTADLGHAGLLRADFVTSLGTIHCQLFDRETPRTVANFVGLARGLKAWRDPRTGDAVQVPFYDGLIFHRVIPRFVIQGGDPTGTGTGGPGYVFADELVDSLHHDRPGVLAMANAGANTNGSQFYITEAAQPYLDRMPFTIFGQCADLDVIRAIARVPRQTGDRPIDPVVIQTVRIYRAEAPR